MRSVQRLASTLAVLALLLTGTAVPALAAATATATISTGDLVSGRGGEVQLVISNTGSTGGLFGLQAAGTSIDAIQIEAPNAIFDVQDVQLPAGWTGGYDEEIGFVYAMTDGEGLAPGGTMVVTLQGAARRIADDTTRTVPVFVSDDGGITLTNAGSPSLTSRILEVVSAVVVKPAGAQPDTTQVTELQDNVVIEVTAVNRGSQPRDVTIGVQQASGTSSITASPQTVSIGALDQQATVELPVTFGAAGTLALDATASSGPSSALRLRMPTITVQPRFIGTYVTNSLSPQTVVQGTEPAFQLRLNKTGAQPVVLDADFSFPGFTTGIDGLQIGAGSVSNTTITFEPTLVDADLEDGSYGSQLRLVGVDGNGALIDVTLTPDLVTLDSLAPVLDLFADVGPSEVAGATPAAGDDRDITFSGTVRLGPAVGADLCTSCTVTRAVVVTDTGDELPFTLLINNGNLMGTASFDFDDDVLSARAEVTVRKANGLGGTGASNTFEVDVIPPTVADAVTQRGADGANDFVLVTFNELVDASATSAPDWSVDDNLVTAVEPVGNAASTNQLRLRVSQDFEINETPALSYARIPLNGTVFDRVALDMADLTKEVRDGIAPLLPVIEQVSGLPLQDGEFWTNQPLTTVTLSGLQPGDVLRLYWDLDDDGVLDTDEEVFRGDVTAETQEVQLQQSLGNVEASHDLIAVVRDLGGNLGPLATEVLNLDFTPAEIISFVASGNDVTAVFSEPVPRGRDAAIDWTVHADQNGEVAYRTVTEVTFLSGTERLLTVSDVSYDPAAGDVLAVRYKSRGGTRYEDRATNAVANQEYRP